MPEPRDNRKPTFVWQSILILLPTFLLAALGFYSLHKDRLLVENEARTRAQQIADALADAVWNDWDRVERASTNLPAVTWNPYYSWLRNGYYIDIDAGGRLLFPPPNPAAPVPQPLDLSELEAEQRDLWFAAMGALFDQSRASTAIETADRLLQTRLPSRWAANASFTLGALLLKAGQSEAAARTFSDVRYQYPQETSESGLPLTHLTELLLLELATPPTNQTLSRYLPPMETIRSNAVYRPSILSVPLLKMALAYERQRGVRNISASEWQRIWTGNETARRAYRAAQETLGRSSTAPLADQLMVAAQKKQTLNDQPPPAVAATFPRVLAVQSDQIYWLLRAGPAGAANVRFFALPHDEIQSLFFDHLREIEKSLPPYLAVAARLDGHAALDYRLPTHASDFWRESGKVHTHRDAQPEPPPVLLAEATKQQDGTTVLGISVYLTDRSALLTQHSQRTRWFGLLIAGAVASALVGWLAARNAFHRQQRLVEMKTNFVSSVSHELRAPVASMRLLAESLERGKISNPSKQTEYFRLMVQECRRLSSLIGNVLDFSSIDQGRKQYAFEPTDLDALVRQTMELMEPYAKEREVTLAIAPSNLPSTTGGSQPATHHPHPANVHLHPALDGRAIQQALVNLLDNAIKHAPSGTIVKVGLEFNGVAASRESAAVVPSGEPGTRKPQAKRISGGFPTAASACLWVEDAGDGIPPHEQEKIFEPFYRRGTELRRETQGIGIGLTIVKHVVEAHGGRVRVHSAVGQGSRFTIELPVNQFPMTKLQ